LHTTFTEERLYHEHAVIAQQGEAACEAYLVLEGACDVFACVAHEPEAEVEVCAQLLPGDFFGLEAALQGAPHVAGLRAGSNCVIAVLSDPGSTQLPEELLSHVVAFGGPFPMPWRARGLDRLEHKADLGEGRYGAVLLMRDTETGSPCALKLMMREEVRKGKQSLHVLVRRSPP